MQEIVFIFNFIVKKTYYEQFDASFIKWSCFLHNVSTS